MAKRGRKPVPKVEAVTAGAIVPPDRPEPPADLDGIALAYWHSLCDDLAGQGTLAVADRKLMEAACRFYATFRRAADQLANEELVKVSEVNGRSFINPLVTAMSDLGNKLRQCLNDLGLTAKARKAPKPPEREDKLSTFLKAT